MDILEKWKVLVEAAKKYYVDFEPTGLLDSEYDELEKKAEIEDGFIVKDYIFNTYYPKGSRYKNSEKITKFKKKKVEGLMFSEIEKYGPDYYYPLKYDGNSLAIYLNPETGQPIRAVTCGNSSIGFGIDQTWKIIGLGLIPSRFPKGLEDIQCECLIDLDRMGDLDPERARQKACGIINGKKSDILEDAKNLLTLRAYRYHCADTVDGKALEMMDYKEVIESLPVQKAKDGHITFAPADIYTLDYFKEHPGFCETDHTRTSTGFFLNDGIIVYNKHGEVVIGLKYAGAGSTTETLTKTQVLGLQWNNQALKGKDSWSVNVLVEPVILHGSTHRKPAGSAAKIVKENITPGAEVSIILANSTIPMVGDVFKPGNGDFMWPKCSCGYQMSEKDIFGSVVKCGNPNCSERLERMKAYLDSISGPEELNLDLLLVIDRFKWGETTISIDNLLGFVRNSDETGYYEYLKSFLTTALQKKTLDLVWKPSFNALTYVLKK